MLSANAFKLVQSNILLFGKELTLYQRAKFQTGPNWKHLLFADDKLDVVGMMISLFDGLENTVGKGENTGYQRFLLPVFSKAFFLGVIKSWDCVVIS